MDMWLRIVLACLVIAAIGVFIIIMVNRKQKEYKDEKEREAVLKKRNANPTMDELRAMLEDEDDDDDDLDGTNFLSKKVDPASGLLSNFKEMNEEELSKRRVKKTEKKLVIKSQEINKSKEVE